MQSVVVDREFRPMTPLLTCPDIHLRRPDIASLFANCVRLEEPAAIKGRRRFAANQNLLACRESRVDRVFVLGIRIENRLLASPAMLAPAREGSAP